MSDKFLFDTNAVRGLGLEGFKKLDEMEEVEVYTSPYNFWEILCHIEEDFQCYRRHLIKFKYTNVLDSPERTTLSSFFPEDSDKLPKVPDRIVIRKAVEKLDDSNSLKDFYSKNIEDNCGIREISGCATAAQKVLDKMENEFIKKRIGKILDDLFCGEITVPDEGGYETLDHIIRDRPEEGDTDTYGDKTEAIHNQTYLFTSYMLHLALKYYSNGNTVGDISRNDFEDAAITLHLNIDTDKTLVSSDSDVLKIVKKTKNIITQVKGTPTFEIQSLETFRSNFGV